MDENDVSHTLQKNHVPCWSWWIYNPLFESKSMWQVSQRCLPPPTGPTPLLVWASMWCAIAASVLSKLRSQTKHWCELRCLTLNVCKLYLRMWRWYHNTHNPKLDGSDDRGVSCLETWLHTPPPQKCSSKRWPCKLSHTQKHNIHISPLGITQLHIAGPLLSVLASVLFYWSTDVNVKTSSFSHLLPQQFNSHSDTIEGVTSPHNRNQLSLWWHSHMRRFYPAIFSWEVGNG